MEGVDATAPDGRTVQIKATGTRRGPAFRCTGIRADHLLFLDMDFVEQSVEIIFNGPERVALAGILSTTLPGHQWAIRRCAYGCQRCCFKVLCFAPLLRHPVISNMGGSKYIQNSTSLR